ncbi:MAG: YgjV family protein [Actinomycetales bacterium]|nr:YgjV family protein [Actinomycetales bacterium]
MNWATLLEILGWTGSAILVWSLLQSRILRLRLINLVGCVLLIGYNVALEVWPMVGLNVVLAIINIVYLRKLLGTRHDEASYEILEVAPDEVYVRHFLRTHAADVAAFNAHLDAARLTLQGRIDDDGAPGVLRLFLVLRGTETVGVVALRPEPGGVGVVELDYVTERFRDFTPGEFVFRRSATLAAQGFTHIEVPEAMAAPYYERIGFTRVGDGYALDLTP